MGTIVDKVCHVVSVPTRLVNALLPQSHFPKETTRFIEKVLLILPNQLCALDIHPCVGLLIIMPVIPIHHYISKQYKINQ